VVSTTSSAKVVKATIEALINRGINVVTTCEEFAYPVPANAKVTMNYIGVSCSTGKIFDSTYAHNQTFPADLSSTGNLIKGWQQGIPGMKVGGVRILAIPPALGYGAHGNPPTIAPDEALYFLVSAEKLT